MSLLIPGRPRDLGGFGVRRVLPAPTHRMVGPFIFFDHMGPVHFKPGQGIDVRPHPHINLATVTYLFAGAIHHRDSLGSDQLIHPGAINWMTAGRGIVHSERKVDGAGGDLHGIQLWVALPQEHEETAPSFCHHPRETLPEFAHEGAPVKLLLGTLLGQTSPVPVHSNLFYAQLSLRTDQELTLPFDGREAAVYAVDTGLTVNGQDIPAGTMVVAGTGEELRLRAQGDGPVMYLGGASLGKRFIDWNFVSSRLERIEEAKRLWAQGPQVDNPRFHPIPGDDLEYVPLPS